MAPEPIQQDAEEARREFERSAIEAARGWLKALDELRDALRREAKLKAQVAALVGLEDPR